MPDTTASTDADPTSNTTCMCHFKTALVDTGLPLTHIKPPPAGHCSPWPQHCQSVNTHSQISCGGQKDKLSHHGRIWLEMHQTCHWPGESTGSTQFLAAATSVGCPVTSSESLAQREDAVLAIRVPSGCSGRGSSPRQAQANQLGLQRFCICPSEMIRVKDKVSFLTGADGVEIKKSLF